ncbi:MAG TPA: type VI secretion system baseplate subunit TssK [Terracidiphilus sp.]|jgi:type VI secretion system protein ImpJ|nr:type VI secretion system baseplate subunit TssK [Terracidiphilus sp.]
MKQLQPVLWSKGTLLTPQHLQLQDKYLEDSMNFRVQSLKFCAWGFTELAIDQELLAEGQLAVSRAAGIFPDGLLFEIPGPDQAPPSKALGEYFDPGVKDLDVYLTVPDYKEKGINVAGLGRTAGSRYLAEIAAVRDENTGIGEKTVQIARKNLRLLAANESREGSSELCIANIEKTETGRFRLNPRHIPPLLEASANGFLLGLVNGILEILSAKSTQLSGSRRQRNQSLAEFTTADIANFWLLYAVNSNIPVLNHLLQGQRCHPEELFSALTALGASLTTFSSTVRPRDLPLYDHSNLTRVFTELDEKLRLLLDTVIPTNVVSLPLKHVANTVYATSIDQDKYLNNTRMYLAVSADASEETIIKRVPQLVKVCSATHIDQLITKALPGAALIHVPAPPSAIPVKMKYHYFSVDQAGAAWESVTRARNFAAHVPGDLQNPQMELVILLPQAGKPL